MRICAVLLFSAAVSACQPVINEQGAASPELAAQLDLAVAEANAQVGQQFNRDVDVRGASRNGNTFVMDLTITGEFGRRVDRAPEGELRNAIEPDWRRSLCADPEFQPIFALGGRYQTRFFDDFGRRVLTILVDRC